MPRGGARGGARAAAALAQKLAKTPKSSKTLDDTHAFLHDHAHHEPHFPEGVEPGMWKQEVRKFEADGLQMVSDPNVVGAWSEVDVAAWIACISTNKFEHYSDKFLRADAAPVQEAGDMYVCALSLYTHTHTLTYMHMHSQTLIHTQMMRPSCI